MPSTGARPPLHYPGPTHTHYPPPHSMQVLNAFYWGTSLSSMQKEGRQLAVSAMRGGLLWLEVCVGKGYPQ